jgi:2-isopropylmalate synthase
MFTQGVNPHLNFHDINGIVDVYERVCRLEVHPRHPYAGELVYTAFSGSHQDAINKGMHAYAADEGRLWEVPYLPIDPNDVGRTYESIIRINSQSGKGGVAFIMEQDFGFRLPKAMQPEFGKIIQGVTDSLGRELQNGEIYKTFEAEYLKQRDPFVLLEFNVVKHHITADEQRSMAEISATLRVHGREMTVGASGNGPLDAFCAAMRQEVTGEFKLCSYHEHALEGGSSAKAAAYIELESPDGSLSWGTGVDTDITIASIRALLSGLNRLGGLVPPVK